MSVEVPVPLREEIRECEVCGEIKPSRYCGACEAWICARCWKDVPARAIAGYIRLRRKVRAGTLWKEVFSR